MNLTLRSRLTLIYTAVFGVLLAGLGAASYRALAYELDADVTDRLNELTSGLHGYFNVTDGQPRIAFDTNDAAEAAFVAEATRYYAIFDATSGELIVQSDALSPLGLQFTPAEIRQFRERPVAFDVETDYGRIRLSNSLLGTPGGGRYLLQVGVSLAGMDRVLWRFLVLLTIAVPLGLIITFAIGRWLAGLALEPLADVAEAARSIDIGDLRRLPVRGVHDELDDVAQSFNETLARLEHAVAEMRQFSTALAHEIRTPLAALRSGIEAAMFEPMGPQAQRQLADQLEEIDKLKRMIGQILTLARAEAGEIPLADSEVDLSAVASSIVEQIEGVARDKGIELRCGRADGAIVRGDPEWLKRAVLNLLDNAIKFTPRGGEIVVSVTREAESASLEVRDTGIGIPPDAQPHIFERYFRVDPARSAGGDGVGLGLSLAKWIVDRHRGHISVESTIAGGSAFTVRLPIARSAH